MRQAHQRAHIMSCQRLAARSGSEEVLARWVTELEAEGAQRWNEAGMQGCRFHLLGIPSISSFSSSHSFLAFEILLQTRFNSVLKVPIWKQESRSTLQSTLQSLLTATASCLHTYTNIEDALERGLPFRESWPMSDAASSPSRHCMRPDRLTSSVCYPRPRRRDTCLIFCSGNVRC